MMERMIAYSTETLVMFAAWVLNTQPVMLCFTFVIVAVLFGAVLALARW